MAGVVSNASPIIVLSAAGEFHRLETLFGRIWVARDVYDEVLAGGPGKAGVDELKTATFVQVESPKDVSRVDQLHRGLGRGESATIVLASELAADLVLMDDGGARKAARAAGLKVAGSMRVLEFAYERGLVPDLAAAYRKLKTTTLWINPRLLDESLSRHGLPPLK